MISGDRLEKALTYLATTDVTAAQLKVEVSRKEYIAKKVRARMFLQASGNNEERKAQAETSAEVEAAESERFAAEAEFEKLKAKRLTEELVIEVWRSLEASRRQGSIQ